MHPQQKNTRQKMRPSALDIETTGFLASDEVTLVGIQVPLGSLMLMQTDGRHVDEDRLTRDLEARSGRTARVRAYEDEQSLLEAVSEEVNQRIVSKDGVYLVGYNAETYYKGGFDFPFLRGSYNRYDLDWPFRCAYVDLIQPVRNYANTNLDEDTELNDLVGAYDIIVGDGDGEYDPFDNSLEAVDAFREGEWVDLLAHCQSDIRRTQALARFAESYIAKKDRRMKNLSPD
jgi:hypothetical protein